MPGRNESTRALAMVKRHCCAFNCTNSTQKQKNVETYPELANVRCFPFPQDNPNKYYAARMSEQQRRLRWIAACCLDSLNVKRHTRICSVHFDGGLGPTKLNPVPSIFAFPQHLQRKLPKSRSDPKERRRRQRKETPQPLNRNKWIMGRTKNILVVKEPIPHFSEPVYVDAEVQTDLTASHIDVMADCNEKLENKTQLKRHLVIEDICKNDQTVRFYTGIPSLGCLFMVFNFLKPIAEKMKYWDGKKRRRRKLIRLVNVVFRWDFKPIFIHYYKLQFFSCAALKNGVF